MEKSKNLSVPDIYELSQKELSLYALGLDWNKLSIVPYNPLWPIIYKIESKRILNSLCPWLKRIEHIGSTAVPYLSAKPIIDIIGAVSSIESIDSQILNFYELGYNYFGECGRQGRNIAEYLGLKVIGTLGVLVKAKRLKIIDSFKDEAYCMLEAGIRYHHGLIDRIILELGE
ncbi:MAG: GrpB family protein [Spirochaetia bacterium]|nr:GrpB family protein [Spirochaetia bacterium]